MRLSRNIATLAVIALAAIALAPTGAAGASTGCPDVPMARSFSWALDPTLYFRMPGGDFEDGGASWTLSGGAKVASGLNETVMPASPTDSHALRLPAGSSAESAPICAEGTATTMRFFARSEGLAGIAVVVVTATNESGATQTLLSPAIALTPAWSAPIATFRLPLLGDHLTSVTVKVRSIGLSPIDVDDVYIDPLRQR